MNQIQLSPAQIAAVQKMRNGCILCAAVGTGKSRTALAYYYIQNGGSYDSLEGKDGEKPPKRMRKPLDLYIITTAKKRDSLEWEEEMIPFGLFTDPKTSLYKNKVVVDSWNNIRKYVTITDAFFIFDEDRVTGEGKWAKRFIKIAHRNQWIMLSATPGDCWMDYWAVFTANRFYRNQTEFKHEHVVYKRYVKFPAIDRYINTGRLIRLRNRILVDMDAINQAEKHMEDVWTDYDKELYRGVIRKRWNPYKKEPIDSASSLCVTLRRIVNTDPSRFEAVLKIFEDHPRLIIFYNYDFELDILKTLDYGKDVEVAEWNGHKHQEVPKTQKWVYLVHYLAGAEGWNCITTDTIVFFSQTYSYRTVTQAQGRIDRMNTPYKHLYYYTLKSRSGIDLAISKALADKKTFNESRYYNSFNGN